MWHTFTESVAKNYCVHNIASVKFLWVSVFTDKFRRFKFSEIGPLENVLLYGICWLSFLGVANGDHNTQTITASGSCKAVLDSVNVMGPDYDEIKDELYTEKSSEKLHQLEDKSMELTKSSNNYFTLMPQEAQMESITNVNLVSCYF